MEVSNELLDGMNRVYYELNLKKSEIFHALYHRIFELSVGWYNEHYVKDDSGAYRVTYYPIPVISVKGFCDIEITFDEVSVTTHLRREAALEYSYDRLKDYPFEAYGVEEYESDYYHPGLTVADLKENIRRGDEKEIGFAFTFPFEVDGRVIFEFVKLLRREGFYY